jgi:hypothetical protein
MPITTNTQLQNVQRNTGNMTDTNEVILKVDPRYTTALDAIMVAAGVAQVFVSTDPNYDALANGFAEMTPDDTGAQSASFNRIVEAGVTWIGLNVTSGTWKMNIMQRKEAFVG